MKMKTQRKDAKNAKVMSKLHPDFISYFFRLELECGGRASIAYRRFKAAWFRLAQIPGMDNQLSRHRLPVGYSYCNILSQSRSLVQKLRASASLR